MGPNKERYPPRYARRIAYLTFDWESRKADYRSYVEEFRDRAAHGRLLAAQLWAYRSAAKSLWEVFPPDLRGALFALAIKFLLRS